VFARWTAEQARASAPLEGAAAALWQELEGAWQDEARHDAFVKHCSQAGLLGPAGRLYRERLDRDPADAIAARMQKRIVAMATAALAPIRAPAAPLTQRRWFAWLVLGAILLGGLLAVLLRSRR
jgi:hypothetical protein